MGTKTIVLIAERMSDRLILLGKLWKNSGYSTCAIYCIGNGMFNNLGNIDIIIKAVNPSEIFAIATRIDNKIIHYFNYGPDNLGYLLTYNNIPFIYDYKDLFGTTQTSLTDPNAIQLEVDIVSRAKAITRRDNQLLYFSQQAEINLQNICVRYVPECFETDPLYEISLLKKLSESKSRDADLKLVLTGGYPPEFDENKILYEGILHLINHIAKQNIKVTIIGGFSNNHSLDNMYHSQLPLNKNVKISPALTTEDFDLELLSYDFAIHMINNDFREPTYSSQFTDTIAHKSCGSARIYPYIKACLPVLTGNSLSCVTETIGDSGFSINLTPSQLDNLRPLLETIRESRYRNLIYSKRSYFSIDKLQDDFSGMSQELVLRFQ